VRTRIFELKRQRFLQNAGGGSRHPTKFWRPEEVPEFEGDRAWFEAQWVTGCGWRIQRRVDENGRPHEG